MAVVSTTLDGLRASTVDEAVNRMMERMDAAAASPCDVICLPEFFAAAMLPVRPAFAAVAEDVPGRTTARMADWARVHRTHVVCPLIARRSGHCYNTTVLIGRNGAILGKYDKRHLSPREMQRGGSCGARPPVVLATDFGKVGLLTCFDANWPEEWAALRAGGAEIVFWPSAYGGGLPLRAHAALNNYFLVTSPWGAPGQAEVIDPTGTVAAASATGKPWTAAAVNLESAVFTIARNEPGLKAALARYGEALRARWMLVEDWCWIEVLQPGLTLAHLCREFDLAARQDFLRQCGQAHDANRARTAEGRR